MHHTNKLHLSRQHRVIAGVCGGLAEYFETDPAILRLIFLFFTLFGGAGLLLYFFLWAFMSSLGRSEHPTEPVSNHHEHQNHGVIGFFLIVIGAMLLLDNMFPGYGIRTYWPLLLIFFGLSVLFRRQN